MARCILKDTGFPTPLCGEMFMTATYIANRTPHAALNSKSPFEVRFDQTAKLDHHRAIGARAFVHIQTHTKKLVDKAWEGKLCGYSLNGRAYRIYNAATKRVTESRNVIRSINRNSRIDVCHSRLTSKTLTTCAMSRTIRPTLPQQTAGSLMTGLPS